MTSIYVVKPWPFCVLCNYSFLKLQSRCFNKANLYGMNGGILQDLWLKTCIFYFSFIHTTEPEVILVVYLAPTQFCRLSVWQLVEINAAELSFSSVTLMFKKALLNSSPFAPLSYECKEKQVWSLLIKTRICILLNII